LRLSHNGAILKENSLKNTITMKFSNMILIISIMISLSLFAYNGVMQETIYEPMISEIDTLRAVEKLNIDVNYIQTKQIDSLKNRLHELENPNWIPVVGTTYNPVAWQCDDTPDVLADGTKIDVLRATEYKYIAVSQNMLTRNGGHLNFNDYVYISNTKKHDGIYQVKDVMNKRFTNRIDFLQTYGDKNYVYRDAKMLKIEILG